MSWHFLQGQEAASWEGISLDGAPSALLKLMPSPEECSLLANGTECSRPFQSGTTCERSTGVPGRVRLTLCQVDSPARTYQSPAAEKDSMGSEADCGPKCPESFARFDPNSFSWKTRQHLLHGGFAEYSESFPRWGSMRNGECSALAPLVPHIHGRGCSWWPTPVMTDHKRGKGSPAHRLANGRAVVDRPSKSRFGATLPDILGGTPNPTWIEWLMAWPENWTACESLAMDKFHAWRQAHGGF